MADCRMVGMLSGGKWDRLIDNNRRVYSIDGISPTVTTCGGGGQEVKIAINQATEQGYAECEIGGVADLFFPNSKTRRGRVQEGGTICPTITAESSGLCRIEPYVAAMRGRESSILTPKRTEYGKAVRKDYESGKHQESRHTMQQLEPRCDGVTNTLTTVQKDNLLIEPHFRVRKLTPKECWRLMDFTDNDFDKAKIALNRIFHNGADRSNSQMYKQAGNSIVVAVIVAIAKTMKSTKQEGL